MSQNFGIIFNTMARMISPHTRHFLALLLLASVRAAYAEPAVEVQRLANHIVLDDSSETELVISNVAEDENLPEANRSIQPPFKKLRWQTGSIPYQAEVEAAAQSMQVDPALIHAVIATESGYNPQAQSRKGAYGLMQVLPATAKSLSAIPVKQWSVRQQILWGSRYLKNMLVLFEGDVTLALAAYNAGPNAVKMRQNTLPPFAETRQYVPRVLSYYRAFKIRLPHEAASPE